MTSPDKPIDLGDITIGKPVESGPQGVQWDHVNELPPGDGVEGFHEGTTYYFPHGVGFVLIVGDGLKDGPVIASHSLATVPFPDPYSRSPVKEGDQIVSLASQTGYQGAVDFASWVELRKPSSENNDPGVLRLNMEGDEAPVKIVPLAP